MKHKEKLEKQMKSLQEIISEEKQCLQGFEMLKGFNEVKEKEKKEKNFEKSVDSYVRS